MPQLQTSRTFKELTMEVYLILKRKREVAAALDKLQLFAVTSSSKEDKDLFYEVTETLSKEIDMLNTRGLIYCN